MQNVIVILYILTWHHEVHKNNFHRRCHLCHCYGSVRFLSGTGLRLGPRQYSIYNINLTKTSFLCVIFNGRYSDGIRPTLAGSGFDHKDRICSFSFISQPALFLKGQYHEIFDPRFFGETVPLGPLIHGLKRF
jgi:hypothetical protein